MAGNLTVSVLAGFVCSQNVFVREMQICTNECKHFEEFLRYLFMFVIFKPYLGNKTLHDDAHLRAFHALKYEKVHSTNTRKTTTLTKS